MLDCYARRPLQLFRTMNTRYFSRYISFLLPLLLCMAAGEAIAQVEVAPTRVIVTMRERSQEINVTNTSEGPVEVNTDLGFKLIRTDSLGLQTLDTARTPAEMSRSGRGWIKIFPRRFTLPPRGSRIVRVMVTIPDTAGTGEYWARLIVTGTPVSSTVPVDFDPAQGIETSITMRMELDLPVIIRKGNVETGIDFQGLRAHSLPDATLLVLDMQRTGNSAYRGTLNAVLRDNSGNEIAQASEQYTAEFSLHKSIRFPRLADGTYTVAIESQSTKRGGANDAVIPAPNVARSYTLHVAGEKITIAAKE